jgi:hypothetical protein
VLEIGLRLFEPLICLLSGRQISFLDNKDVFNVFNTRRMIQCLTQSFLQVLRALQVQSNIASQLSMPSQLFI